MLLFIVGTRPELIKIAPLILELRKRNFKSYSLVNTGQHKELLDKYWKVFGITPDHSLDVLLPNQDLSSLTTRAMDQLNRLVIEISSQHGKPDFIISQGDTTTVLAASMVAFYHKIKFAHVEAGLRSFDLSQPYPEEFNRRVASIAATIHFSPTQVAKNNLIKENIPEEQIRVVGNTGIDALNIILKSDDVINLTFTDNRLNQLVKSTQRNIVLITCHRRENHGENLLNIIDAISTIAKKRNELNFVWPVHENPKVKNVVLSSRLSSQPNVFLTQPLDYVEVIRILSKTSKLITDSGGLQEEAPSFGIPVLVLRDKTERPEVVEAGFSKLVGGNSLAIIESFDSFNPVFPESFKNPYGDGYTSSRIIDSILGDHLGVN